MRRRTSKVRHKAPGGNIAGSSMKGMSDRGAAAHEGWTRSWQLQKHHRRCNHLKQDETRPKIRIVSAKQHLRATFAITKFIGEARVSSRTVAMWFARRNHAGLQ